MPVTKCGTSMARVTLRIRGASAASPMQSPPFIRLTTMYVRKSDFCWSWCACGMGLPLTLFPFAPWFFAPSPNLTPPPPQDDVAYLWNEMNGGIGVWRSENGNMLNWAASVDNTCNTMGKIIYVPSGDETLPYILD